MKNKFEIQYKKALNFTLFLLIFVTSSFIALILKANLFFYNFIALLPSTIFLLYLNKQYSKKILLEGLLAGFLGEVLFDRFAHSSRAWFSPSMFSVRPLGLPIENLIWCLLYVVMTFAYYEYFFDASRSKKLPKSHKNWIIIATIILFTIPLLFMIAPVVFNIPYFYFLVVVLLIVIDLLLFSKYPRVSTKAFIASAIVIPLGFVHEFVSLELNHWIFTKGFHIGYLNLFGYSIPYEEMIFYLVAPMALMCLYELVLDNKKD